MAPRAGRDMTAIEDLARDEDPPPVAQPADDRRFVERSRMPDAPRHQSFVRSMRSAALWSGLNSFALRLGQFAVGIVIARIIAPKEFGVFAVAMTVYSVIANVSELGVSAALIRAKGDVRRVAPTIATISIAASVLLTTIMFCTAGPLATVLGAPGAAGAVRILSITVFLAGLTAVPYALLVREFRQDKRFVADGCNFIASTGLVIVLGFAGMGAIALAISKVLGQLVSLVLLYLMVTPRYRPGWNRDEARSALTYSLPLAGASVVTFLLGNVDYIVVGRTLGALWLGFYVLAYNIAGWPVSVFGLMINEVALPAFALTRDQRSSLAKRVSGAVSITAAAALPVSALCLALSLPLVSGVYGPRWHAAAAPLAMLGVFGSVRLLLTLLTNILAALGRSGAVLTIQLVWICTLVPALIVGVGSSGILGAAIAQEVVAIGIVLPLALWWVSRAGGGNGWLLLRGCVFPLVAAAAACLAAYAVTLTVDSPWFQLILGAAVGLTVYVVTAGRLVRSRLREFTTLWNAADTPARGPSEEQRRELSH
jgi:lipopolysaccharide exporter